VLASPACAVRPDTLWLLRRAAGADRHVWPTIERRFGRGEPAEDADAERHLDAIPEDDATALRELCELLAELRAEGGRLALDELIELAVTGSGYDLTTLLMDRGARRYANVRKLMRLARSFEAAEGRDLRGFLEFVAQSAGVDREGEAATEAEEHDGVRVMTIHAAKGLEFGVVAVADLGRELLAGASRAPIKVGDAGDEEPALPRVGIRLARLGASAVGIFGYDELVEAAATEEAAEACRLAYVAATRAQDRLILSGRYNARRLAKPATDMALTTPITERLMRGLEIAPGEDVELSVPPPRPRPGLDEPVGAGRIAVRFNLPEPDSFRALGAHPGSREPVSATVLGHPPLGRPAPTPEPGARHLSYSALATYGRCGYRFYAERVLGLSRADGEAATDAPSGGRFAFGNAVHAILEWCARHDWRPPDEALCRDLLRREGVDGAADLGRARDLVGAWLGSKLCEEVAERAAARAEMPFILGLGDSVVRGTIDLYVPGEVPLIVDYKTDALPAGGPSELVDRYGTQRKVYALAAQGASRVRTAYVFLERADEPVEHELDSTSLADARDELSELIAGIRDSRFEVTEEPHAALCWDCPARARLCSHPPEATGRRLR
jgi:ATP-dependent exoDNAse (exonuclease V) beta subunit